jgi:hypothetical protein
VLVGVGDEHRTAGVPLQAELWVQRTCHKWNGD